MCVCIALCIIVAHDIAQNRPDNFPSYHPDNHHCSDDVYLRERGARFHEIFMIFRVIMLPDRQRDRQTDRQNV